MNSVEILDKKAQLKAKAQKITDLCKTEIRDLNEVENAELENIKAELANLNEELRNLDTSITEEKENEIIKTKTKTKMNKEFRLLQAINDIANNRNLSDVATAVVNEGANEMRKAGLSFGGQIQLPIESRSAITVSEEGEDVVVTDFENILEPLRGKNVLVQAGARYLTGLVGDVQVPIMNASNVTWEGETAPAKDGAGTFDHIKLQPKRLTAYIDISKQFLVQDSLDAEALIRQDLVNAINSKLEETILSASAGTTTMPQGIFYSDSALTSVSAFTDICELESDIEDANINGECKYIVSNKAKAALRTMAKSALTNELVMHDGNIDGTAVLNTSHVGGKKIAYGDFSYLAIGQWGGIDLTVDPFSQATNGKVRLVINAFFDAKVLRPEAIAVAEVA